jgi:hypothetical protein
MFDIQGFQDEIPISDTTCLRDVRLKSGFCSLENVPIDFVECLLTGSKISEILHVKILDTHLPPQPESLDSQVFRDRHLNRM